jgi:hypothetical protein
MTRNVPYLSAEKIEHDASSLLAEYAQARGVAIAPPIPIEDVVEKYLKLSIEFDDTHRLFNVPRSGLGLDPDILGAMFFNEGRIVIDESLDPEENPAKEGRYRFTMAHEGGGHWRLHRHLFAKDPSQGVLFGGPATPSVVCRTSQAKERVEWQADFYASCFLMPRKLVLAAWDDMFPDRKQRVLPPAKTIEHPYVEIDRTRCSKSGSYFTGNDDVVLEDVARPLAERFLVSSIAMRIRLEKLGLLLREVPHQHLLAGGA